MTSVLVDSIVVTTDKFAELSQSNITYTTVDLSWLNVSSDTTTFRIVNEAGTAVSSETIVPGSESGSASIVGLVQESTNKLYLERNEHGDWIRQTSSTSGLDYVLTSMKKTSVSTSIGSSAAIVQWSQQHDTASYTLSVTDSSGNTVTFPNSSVVTSNDQHAVTVPDLSNGSTYSVSLSVDELKSDGTSGVVIWSSSFSTSDSATFQVDETYASYASISWTGDGSNESDGIADFRVMGKKSSESTYAEYVASTPDTTNAAVITGLSPGTQYDLKLQRLGVTGSWNDQVQITLTTKTTAMSIQSIGSRSIAVEWPSIYTNAVYQLKYQAAGGIVQTYNDGDIQTVTAIIKSLSPNTEYGIELFVVEQGELVGVSKLALGSSNSVKTSRDYVLIGGVSVAVVAVIAIVALKMKK